MTGTLTAKERSTESPSSTLASGQEASQHQCPSVKKVPWYAAILCRSGIHRGKWEYQTKGECSQLKVCQRCGKTEARIEHQWEWRYIKDGACYQVGTCKRCGNPTRQRTEHIWGPTYSESWNRLGHRCERCGKVETWSSWSDDD